MSWRLVINTLWHAPSNVSGTELAVLLAVAEITRRPGDECDCTQEELAQCARVGVDAVQKALRRLPSKGVNIRVAVGKGRDGRPIYAHHGQASRYLLPWFPARPDCLCGQCRKERRKGGTASALPENQGRTSFRPSRRKGGISSAEGRKSVRGRADEVPPHPVAGIPVAAAAPDHSDEHDLHAALVAVVVDASGLTVEQADLVLAAMDADPDVDSTAGLVRYLAVKDRSAFRRRWLAPAEAAVADRRRADLSAELDVARADPTLRCHHGTDGGRHVRSDTGKPLCPICARAAEVSHAS